MERKLNILKPFFEDSTRKISIRELSRILKINHTTARQHLNKLTDEEILHLEKKGVYSFYEIILSRKFLNLKLFYNLEKIRKSNIIDFLLENYEFPTMVLFGSYASATDNMNSDIDICLITNVKKEISFEKFEKKLNRKISLHKFNKTEWEKLKKRNPNLVNNICNGLVLSGEFEVI